MGSTIIGYLKILAGIILENFFLIDPKDVERYDTTVGIPTNLADGYYSLQVAMLVGNGGVYNSCGKIKVTGGNPSFKCWSSKRPVTNSCLRSGGPARSVIESGLLT